MIPSGRFVGLLVAPLVLSVVAMVVPGAILPMIALDVLIVGVALVDAFLTRGRMRARREFATVQAVGRAFEVTVEVSNLGGRTMRGWLTDDAPGTAMGLPARFELAGHSMAGIRYTLQIDVRGHHAFGDVCVRWLSPLGLWMRQSRLRVSDNVRVYPCFRQLRSWGVQARDDEQRLPVRIRRRPGGENEFERLRPYVFGDSYRHIDWKATARRQKLVSREYGQESNQNLIFLLDCGRMMSARNGDLTTFDHALNASLMMAQVALRHGDRVGLLAFDSTVRAWLPPVGGARSGADLIRGTYDLFPSLDEPNYAMALRYLSGRVRRRSLVVLMTTMTDQVSADLLEPVTRALSRRHLPLYVWLRDMGVEQLVTGARTHQIDHYVGGAAAELLAWRERTLSQVRSKGALVVDVDPADLTPRLLSRYLEVKARRLL